MLKLMHQNREEFEKINLLRSEKQLPPLDPKYDMRIGDYQRAITKQTPLASQASRQTPLMGFHNPLGASQNGAGGHNEAFMLREALKVQEERLGKEMIQAQLQIARLRASLKEKN